MLTFNSRANCKHELGRQDTRNIRAKPHDPAGLSSGIETTTTRNDGSSDMCRAQEHGTDLAPLVLHPKRCAARPAARLCVRRFAHGQMHCLNYGLCDLVAPRDHRPARFLTNTLTALPTPSCAAENSLQIAGRRESLP